MKRTTNRHLLNRQAWVQTLGGITALSSIPVLLMLCFSPDTHSWVKEFITRHLQTPEMIRLPQQQKSYLLPNSVLKIAQISMEEPENASVNTGVSSESSRAMVRFQRTLQAHTAWRTQDVLHAANQNQHGTDVSACPFEAIEGQQSLVLERNTHGRISLARTLNRCAEAVELVKNP